eukprot:TRINITY_DN23262_c0_g1_i2.p1 TRINITY_DN23262_c0_g1~~TRINITY_DN23262_c0_g1_i2.p1  ORF type:complete len:829 (+),score=175.63 TRINITY_DN23262_c0_g1_i2:158-2488(+)
MDEAMSFCKQGLNGMGIEIVHDIRQELSRTAETMRTELTDIMDARQVALEDKLDSIMGKVQHMTGSVADDSEVQTGQIAQITDKLAYLVTELEKVHKKSDLDDMVVRLLERLDLPSVFDLKMNGFFQKFREFQMESRSATADLTRAMDDMRRHSAKMHADTSPEVMNQVIDEVKRGQDLVGQEFHLMVSEIAKIQRHLQLDYAIPDEEDNSQVSATSKHEHSRHTDRKQTSRSDKKDKQELTDKQERSAVQGYHRMKRLRDIWVQVDLESKDVWCQTDPAMQKDKKKMKDQISKSRPSPVKKDTMEGMTDAEMLKAKARRNLLHPQYNVQNFYKTEGCSQAIARSSMFDNFTVVVVAVNAIWIAIDLDLNTAVTLNQADIVFQVMENLFCSYFFVEILIRFLAFERKVHSMYDTWFMFDSILVTSMVAETWIVPGIFAAMNNKEGAPAANLTILRIARLVKLLRLSRITRLLRAVPELMVIIKAIGFAARSVLVFFSLWLIVIYLFAIVMRQITDDTNVGREWFPSVPDAMNTLLLNGIFPGQAEMVRKMGEGSPAYWIVMLIFVLLASITILYMLVGVLVEVVGVISSAEKEGLTVNYVASSIRTKIESQGHSCELPFTKYELQQLLAEPDVCQLLTSVNVDVVVLMDMLDVVYEDIERTGESMSFENLIMLMLAGRGGQVATVRDTKEVLRILKQMMKASTDDVNKRMFDEFALVHASLYSLREEALERDYLHAVDVDEEETAQDEEGAKQRLKRHKTVSVYAVSERGSIEIRD